MAAAGGCRCLTLAWPPSYEHCAWLPRMPQAALLREARKRGVTWLLHVPYSNIRSIYLEDGMLPRLAASIVYVTGHAHFVAVCCWRSGSRSAVSLKSGRSAVRTRP